MSASATPYRPLPSPPRPTPPPWQLPAIALFVASALATCNSHKLVVMYRLRGRLPGHPARIVEVGQESPHRSSDDGDWWDTSLTETAPPYGVYTIQVHAKDGPVLHRGEIITVRCLEDERECFVPNSVYINYSNFWFDRVLLLMESLGILAALRILGARGSRYVRALHSYRKAARPRS